MPLTDTTNALFDTQCAAVPAAVGGPLTRVSDIDADPVISPNSQIPYETTAATAITVNISYDQLLGDDRDKIVHAAHGVQGILKRVFDFIAALDVLFTDNGFDPLTASNEEYTAIMRLFQTNVVPILNTVPLETWDETAPNAELSAAFTESFSDPTLGVTNTSDQDAVSSLLWDWGDGEVSDDWDPADHTYASAGTYTTRLILLGPNGELSIASGAANVVS
jgi:PKD repeat protein